MSPDPIHAAPSQPPAGDADDESIPSLAEATRVWARIGLLSFGGPAGQIALMHSELVERRRWLSESRFLHALNYCMLLPGPEAQQLAVYIGWLLHRTLGGLIAGVLFVLPGFLAILALSLVYVAYGSLPVIGAVFLGLKAAVLAIVAQALLRIAGKTLATGLSMTIAAAAFVAIHAFDAPFPLVILAAALCGLIAAKRAAPRTAAAIAADDRRDAMYVVDRLLSRGQLGHVHASWRRSLATAAIWLLVWWLPVLVVIASFGSDSVLGQQGVFFGQTAMVTFGGAYAVLAYVAQRMVEGYAWITPGEMVDGLALAETTPGPLILVLQFVAFVAAFRHETGLSPMMAGVLASVLATWVTFAPCFLWIFVGAPHVESLRGNRRVEGALSAVTAAVVGVIANLALWFAWHVLFEQRSEHRWGPLSLELPVFGSLDLQAAGLALLAVFLVFGIRLGLVRTLVICALAGLALHWLLG